MTSVSVRYHGDKPEPQHEPSAGFMHGHGMVHVHRRHSGRGVRDGTGGGTGPIAVGGARESSIVHGRRHGLTPRHRGAPRDPPLPHVCTCTCTMISTSADGKQFRRQPRRPRRRRRGERQRATRFQRLRHRRHKARRPFPIDQRRLRQRLRRLSPAHPYFPFVFRFSYRHPLSYYHGTMVPGPVTGTDRNRTGTGPVPAPVPVMYTVARAR